MEVRTGKDQSLHSRAAACSVAIATFEAGDAERARALFAAQHALEESVYPTWSGRWLLYLTRVELALGDIAAAERWADRAGDVAAGLPLPLATLRARMAQAEVRQARGDLAAAQRLVLPAARAATDTAPLDAAEGLLLAGLWASSAGDREQAIELLEQALEQFDRSQAARLRDAAARGLRRLGRRHAGRGPVASGEAGLGSLSAREREVAELVRRGCTNRQIAASMFLSEKTIESHITRIFVKLEVRSRSEVAALVALGDTADKP